MHPEILAVDAAVHRGGACMGRLLWSRNAGLKLML